MNSIYRTYFLLFALAFSSTAIGQFMIPNFEPPTKVDEINSYAEESMPLPCLDGNRLYFLRTYLEDMDGRKEGQDIWYSERGENGIWSEPTPFISSKDPRVNNAIIGASEDGSKVYVFNSTYKKKSLDQKLTFTKQLENNEWSQLKELDVPGLKLDDGYYSFYMTQSEDVLMISMAPADTNAFEDLYVSIKDEDNKWSEIINLGDVVNTSDFEVTPFLAEDKKTLYFASNGHGGLGESDIFVTYRLDNTWQNWTIPLNLGAPINSPDFDAYFAIGNNREVYFTSNRNQDYSDIYYSKISEGVKFVGNDSYVLVKGKYIFKNLPTEGIHISVYDLNGILIDEVITDEFGLFSYTKLNPEESYILKVAEEDFINYPDAKIYVVDESGQLLSRYVLTANETYSRQINDIVYAEQVKGKYSYKNLPNSKVKLVVFDENDFPIDTILTDNNGRFIFQKMNIDDSYYLKPLAVPEEDYIHVAISFLDNQEKEILKAKQGNENLFIYDSKKLKDVLSTQKELLKKVIDYQIEPVLFDFRSVELSPIAKKQLADFVNSVENKNDLHLLITGHADSIGSESVNMKVSNQRANSVKDFLVAKGINSNAIHLAAKGESAPIASNSTEKGRAKNRRVEIEIK